MFPYPEGVAIAADASSPVNAGDTVVIRAKYNHTINNVGTNWLAQPYTSATWLVCFGYASRHRR